MSFVKLVGRYGLAGIANTGLGFVLIMACEWLFGFRPEVANALGYAAGWGLGYVLNRAFVFKTAGTHRRVGPRYIMAVVVAFLANQAVLQIAIWLTPSTALGNVLAQIAGMGTYTLALFVLCALWVFRDTRPAALASPGERR